ncbi:hypothetical protein Sjap_016328 [Stephania japonica]|uniref:Protein SIEVE ELEMENT OCCLUSION B-like n=1 Tax=Stephania japonica TaxID=461633 RepID=A0AAP0IKU1_9MAGN
MATTNVGSQQTQPVQPLAQPLQPLAQAVQQMVRPLPLAQPLQSLARPTVQQPMARPAVQQFEQAVMPQMAPPVANNPTVQQVASAPAAHPMMQQTPVQQALTKVQAPMPVQQMIRSERHLFSSSDDNVMMKQIQATHAPDGREVNVRPLLAVVEDILNRATPGIDALVNPNQADHLDALEDTHQIDFIGMLEALAYTIHKISCEISCKCSGGGDAHGTTLVLFNTLASYSWDAKVVLALAAFAVNYGEFWLVAQLYTTNQLAKSIALLKQLPDILEHNESLRPRLEALKLLIKAMLDVTKCIVHFKELPHQYISADAPVMSMALAHIPTAVYWTIRSVVACMSQMIGLIGLSHEYISSTSETWELSSLAHKLNNIHGHLQTQLELCNQYIDDRRHIEAYQTLVRLFETSHIDNMKILRAMIYAYDDLQPLYDGHSKKRVNLDVLRRKNVLLLISDLDISREELSMLEQMYNESRDHPNRAESHFEVVWLPIVDRSTPWSAQKQTQFETLQYQMPWYSVHHPSLLDPAVIRYIKEVWKFSKKPILVVLDPQGRVVSPNALHMMWIWGALAFPFTSAREDALWKEEAWRMELLIDGIDSNVIDWISEGKWICIFGGEDIDWIRKFTMEARRIAGLAGIQLELLYVGRSNPRERIRKNNTIIRNENLSHIWQDITSIWFFWVRIESMLYSKMQHGKTVENDQIMQEIMTMLSFDGSDQGWALISKGSGGPNEIARGRGETMLNAVTAYDAWKDKVVTKGFVPALNDHLHEIHTPHHCNRLILPGTIGAIPEMVVCAECGRPMEKYIMYRCCID